jgi:hypothetical protein
MFPKCFYRPLKSYLSCRREAEAPTARQFRIDRYGFFQQRSAGANSDAGAIGRFGVGCNRQAQGKCGRGQQFLHATHDNLERLGEDLKNSEEE